MAKLEELTREIKELARQMTSQNWRDSEWIVTGVVVGCFLASGLVMNANTTKESVAGWLFLIGVTLAIAASWTRSRYYKQLARDHYEVVLELFRDDLPRTSNAIWAAVSDLPGSTSSLHTSILIYLLHTKHYLTGDSREFEVDGLGDGTITQYVYELTDTGRRELGLPLKAQLPIQKVMP